jgi:hypothetical protein
MRIIALIFDPSTVSPGDSCARFHIRLLLADPRLL